MIIIHYSGSFLRRYKKYSKELQKDIKDKIQLFEDISNHQSLLVHKLKGHLKSEYSFSVNYKVRIVFEYLGNTRKEVVLLSMGDHDVYK